MLALGASMMAEQQAAAGLALTQKALSQLSEEEIQEKIDEGEEGQLEDVAEKPEATSKKKEAARG